MSLRAGHHGQSNVKEGKTTGMSRSESGVAWTAVMTA